MLNKEIKLKILDFLKEIYPDKAYEGELVTLIITLNKKANYEKIINEMIRDEMIKVGFNNEGKICFKLNKRFNKK